MTLQEERAHAGSERLAVVLATVLAKRETFAAMIDASAKHVDRLIRDGLPTVGRAKGPRVDVPRAIEWMRARAAEQRAAALDDDEQAGRRAAQRAARKRAAR